MPVCTHLDTIKITPPASTGERWYWCFQDDVAFEVD
jgi:hypothetical protein